MTPELDSYREKRRKGRTPEPIPPKSRARKQAKPKSPSRRSPKQANAPSFVIQEHHASSLHWDFRLERDGVLVSWALPKGLPVDPHRNHLAVHVEDHPLNYASFSGEIPQGEYGAGSVSIWDQGTYDCEKWSEREVMVLLHGGRANGRYVLFKTAGRGGKDNWMIHRMDAAPADFEPMPELVRPMLAEPGALPTNDDGWSYEFKWDGLRAVLYVEGGRVRILTRNDHDVSDSYPELREIGERLGSTQAVLDGEIVALDDEGRPSFEALQRRMHVADSSRARRLADEVPVTFLAFDVLYVDGHLLLSATYDERRKVLAALSLDGPEVALPPAFDSAHGADVLHAARERGLEGVVAKRRDSPYRPGRRSGEWVKVKNFMTQEVVIGGYTEGRGRRNEGIGALLLGIPEGRTLRYVGKVGTGFTDEVLADLTRRLSKLRRTNSPFADPLPRAEQAAAHWVRPGLVGEVRFAEWTKAGRLRHPSWRGLRDDKKPAEVVPES